MGRPPAKDRHKIAPIGLRLPMELVARLDAWCESQDPKVPRTNAVVSAIEAFLRERGEPKKTRSAK